MPSEKQRSTAPTACPQSDEPSWWAIGRSPRSAPPQAAIPDADLRLTRRMGELHLQRWFAGSRETSGLLRHQGRLVGHRHVASLYTIESTAHQFRAEIHAAFADKGLTHRAPGLEAPTWLTSSQHAEPVTVFYGQARPWKSSVLCFVERLLSAPKSIRLIACFMRRQFARSSHLPQEPVKQKPVLQFPRPYGS